MHYVKFCLFTTSNSNCSKFFLLNGADASSLMPGSSTSSTHFGLICRIFRLFCKGEKSKMKTLPPAASLSVCQFIWYFDRPQFLISFDFNSSQKSTPFIQPFTSGMPLIVLDSILIKCQLFFVFCNWLRCIQSSDSFILVFSISPISSFTS